MRPSRRSEIACAHEVEPPFFSRRRARRRRSGTRGRTVARGADARTAGAGLAGSSPARLVTAGAAPVSRSRTSSRWTTASADTSSGTRSSSGCTRARCGRKVRPGTASDATWCGATFRTTCRCAGLKTTTASPSSAIPPVTATATRSITRAASFPASTAGAAWSRYEHNGTVTVIADKFQGKRLNSPERHRRASRRKHLVHRSQRTASTATTKASRRTRN